jgi:fructose-bisphosphate aldolase class I
VVTLPGTEKETATTGLDGLAERCKKYYEKGARFAKWRAVVLIGKGLPSELAVQETAHTLARYAIICQENGLVPIVEPEVLADGDHSIDECAIASERSFIAVMKALVEHHVLLEGMLLKPNMITPGLDSKVKLPIEVVAKYTVRTLSRTVLPAIPGIVFLSGGQSEEEASLELNAINMITGMPKPWALTFSFGRALQASCIKAWAGKAENVAAAQKILFIRAQANGQASMGKYQGGTGSKESLAVKNYVY